MPVNHQLVPPLNDFHKDFITNHSEGLSVKEIAKKLGVTYHQVIYFITKNNIDHKPAYKKRIKYKPKLTIEEIKKNLRAKAFAEREPPYQFCKPLLSQL